MGGKDFSLRYQQELEEEIKELYENFCKHNSSKNVFSTFRTPAVLFTGIVALYIASGLTGFIGLEVVAQLFNCMVGLLLIALLTWGTSGTLVSIVSWAVLLILVQRMY